MNMTVRQLNFWTEKTTDRLKLIYSDRGGKGRSV